MKRRHRWIVSLFVYGVLGGCLLTAVACSNTSEGPCSSDYNCPADKPYCVQRQCVASLNNTGNEPVKEAVASEPGPEPVQDGGGKEAVKEESKEEPPSGTCASQQDCSDPTPWCRFGRCSEGYLFFDFRKGHPVIELSQESPPKTCTAHSQCPSWQKCYNTGSATVCLTPPTETEAKGRIGQEGVFMSGRSYSTIVLQNAKEFIRIVMVGELSDKLQQELHIDIPKELVKSNTKIDVAKNNIQVRFYDVKIEFIPPIPKLVAVGTGGVIELVQGPTTYSTRDQVATLMVGSADIMLKRP